MKRSIAWATMMTALAAPANAAAVDKGDTAWMLTATIMVVLMTVPGLAIFYGGLVRAKNVLSMCMQVLICFCVVALLWCAYGYSLAFTANGSPLLNPFIGGFSKVFLFGVDLNAVAATFSKGVYIPELSYAMFQMTFACITPAIVVGAFAERMKFSAIILFLVLWFTFAYVPLAHMAWFWPGPDAYTLDPANLDAIKAAIGEAAAQDWLGKLAAATDAAAKAQVIADYGAAVTAQSGFLFSRGLLDFAGGSVVEVNSGVAGLVCALVLGKRVGYGRDLLAPHSLSLVLVGVGLLWAGWLGFNAGSNLEANSLAALALFNTILAGAAATVAWAAVEWSTRGHPSLLGAASGTVAGLVAITPACGWVGPMGAIVTGLAAGLASFWAVVKLKARYNYDDSLDVFGVHGVGGIVGLIATGIFVNTALGGVGVTDYAAADATTKPLVYAFGSQMYPQLLAIVVAALVSGVVSYVALQICKLTTGLRVTEQEEREGLDIGSHGERAYT
jgi:Amt family ammonium transporter